MLNIIFDILNNRFDDKNIAQMCALILRSWYEQYNIKLNKKELNFELIQMSNFKIKFNNHLFELNIFRQTIMINEQEMEFLVEEIYNYFQKKYPINFDYKLIDPIYFSIFLYDLLDKIVKVKYDNINISKIKLLRKNASAVSMNESERYKALLDKNYKMYSPFNSNLAIHSPRDRLDNALKSISNNGYGYNNQYAIFYNDEPYLRDGQHRVAALKYLYGDIDIKIIRFYLKENFFYP